MGGRNGAAERLGMKRTSLVYKMRKLRISRPALRPTTKCRRKPQNSIEIPCLSARCAPLGQKNQLTLFGFILLADALCDGRCVQIPPVSDAGRKFVTPSLQSASLPACVNVRRQNHLGQRFLRPTESLVRWSVACTRYRHGYQSGRNTFFSPCKSGSRFGSLRSGHPRRGYRIDGCRMDICRSRTARCGDRAQVHRRIMPQHRLSAE